MHQPVHVGGALHSVEAAGHDPASWWRWWRITLAVVVAATVLAVAFFSRFNLLGGSLGGFDNDQFAHLMRTEMLLRGEQPLRDFVDAELFGAWPSLSYAVPAWAQQLGGRTLLPEAYLTAGALAIGHAIVFLLALAWSRRWSVSLLGAAFAIGAAPKLYNYPKVLMLALGCAAVWAVASRPSGLRLGMAAVVTAAATLFRHDFGVYVGVGIVAALVARDLSNWSVAGRRVALFALLTSVCLLPSAVWVQRYEGISTYIARALATTRIEMQRTRLQLPAEWVGPLTPEGTLLVTYYAFWGVLVAAALVLTVRVLGRAGPPLTPASRGAAAGLLAMTALVDTFFLRANLGQRFGDAAVPVVLLVAWASGAAAAWSSPLVRRAAAILPVVLLAYLLGTTYLYSDLRSELTTSGLAVSWEATALRYQEVRDELRRLPPDTWTDADSTGLLTAARYVAECTAPDDYLFIAGHAQEVPVFARRRFAGGQATVSLGLYTSEPDQRLTISRLERQSVPVVLADARDFEDGFSSDYPLIARYVAEAYQEAGAIAVDGEVRFRVFVDAKRKPVRTDPRLNLPCFR